MPKTVGTYLVISSSLFRKHYVDTTGDGMFLPSTLIILFSLMGNACLKNFVPKSHNNLDILDNIVL